MLSGVFVSVVIMAALVIATLALYLLLRRNHPQRKVLNEALVIGGAFLLSFIFRLVSVLECGNESIPDGIANGFYVLYSTIGGVTFEGVDNVNQILSSSPVLQCLYYGSIAYTAIVFLTIVTAGVNYEFYSYIKTFGFRKQFDAVYVFTNVSEASLLLASSIKDKEEKKAEIETLKKKIEDLEKKIDAMKAKKDDRPTDPEQAYTIIKRKNDTSCNAENSEKTLNDLKKELKTLKKDARRRKKKYAIIFLGNELEAFDKKEEMHRAIMYNDFYYWSYGKAENKDKERSILKILHFKKFIDDSRSESHNNHLHVFALANDNSLRGAENKNSDVVFDDITATIKDYVNVGVPTPVNYYIFTNADSNYEFYKTRIAKLTGSTPAPNSLTEYEKKNYWEKQFQLHILNEAQLTGENLSAEFKEHILVREENQKDYSHEDVDRYLKFFKPNDENDFRIAVLGFGETGQYALDELFIASSYLSDKNDKSPDERFRASSFIADVYDSEMDTKSGLFAYSHPLYLCKNAEKGDPELSKTLKAWARNVHNQNVSAIVNSCMSKMSKNRVYDLMGFPIVVFHNRSCFDKDFMNEIDEDFSRYDYKKADYKAFIVALGKDEYNIAMANSLIDDAKHELLLGGDSAMWNNKVIFVNIRDEKNVYRLNWTDEDKQNFKNTLTVVTFGCREKVWSYKNIIDDDTDSIYNYLYSLYDPYAEENNKKYERIGNDIKEDVEKNRDGWKDRIRNESNYRDIWLKLDTFKKASNRSAMRFGINFFLSNAEDNEYFRRTEHLRWNRFHMANGWVFADYEKAEKNFRRHNKEHTCLKPFELLDEGTKLYDGINVKLSIVLNKDQFN